MFSAEDVRRFVSELARRRVFQVVAIYGGVAFGVLEGTQLVVEALQLPPRIVPALTIIVLFGFPVALGIGWLYDLEGGRLQRTPDAADAPPVAPDEYPAGPVFSWPVRIVGLTTLVVVIALSWYTTNKIIPPEPVYGVTDPRGSYIVAAVASRGQSDDDVALADAVADRLGFKLYGWEGLRVVQGTSISGMLYELGIEENEAPTLDQLFDMARAQQLGSAIGLRVAADDGTARLEALLYDVASEREFARSIAISAPRDDLDSLVAPVARAILQLRDKDVSTDELRSESPDLQAQHDFWSGLDALHDWRLTDAEGEFRAAIAGDSLFAAAYHYLGITLYWQTSRFGALTPERGPEIARLTQTASRIAKIRDLRPGLRQQIEAFRALWAGDYETARTEVNALLARDSTDTEAWLLLGAIEFDDPYLEELPDGKLRPRRNPNLARRAFERASELSPDYQLSYGHLFALDRELLAPSALGGACPAFEPPDAPRIPPYVPPEAGGQEAFCPVMRDSVVWLPYDEFERIDRKEAARQAEIEMRTTRRRLETWAAIHPDHPRPHEELDRWLTWRRSLLSCGGDTTEIGELTQSIIDQREKALELRRDTTPEDWGRLALVRLVGGDSEGALAAVKEAGPGGAATDIYLALGMSGAAIEEAKPLFADASWARRDPADGSFLVSGDVAPLVREIEMRGASGDAGPELGHALDRLQAAWSPPQYTPRQNTLLRELMLDFGIAPGLLLQADRRAAWFAGWHDLDLEVPPLWVGLAAPPSAPPSVRRQALTAVLAELSAAPRTVAFDHFAAGILAREAGRDSVAAAEFRRIESCPLSLDQLDDGWGFRTLGRFYLSRTLDALGDSTGAARARSRFTALWRGSPDGPADPTGR